MHAETHSGSTIGSNIFLNKADWAIEVMNKFYGRVTLDFYCFFIGPDSHCDRRELKSLFPGQNNVERIIIIIFVYGWGIIRSGTLLWLSCISELFTFLVHFTRCSGTLNSLLSYTDLYEGQNLSPSSVSTVYFHQNTPHGPGKKGGIKQGYQVTGKKSNCFLVFLSLFPGGRRATEAGDRWVK